MSLMGFGKARRIRTPLLPRTPIRIAELMQEGPHDADCRDCHTAHAADQIQPQEHALTGPIDNTLCERCHTEPWAGGSYAGTPLYLGSAHGSGISMVWPGPSPPARNEMGASGKCLNCHDPHGWEDRDGRIPSLALAREENLCLTCHDGAHAASDVRGDTRKAFVHPTTSVSGRHQGPEESDPLDFANTPVNRRHAECVDCHNPHVARHEEEGFAIGATEASKRLLGVSRVAVANGAAGTVPVYTFIAAEDTTAQPVAEYQLCFKCHSSWTRQPGGQTDLAKALNPANPSYHPVEAPGANPAIDPTSFAGSWTAASTVRCGDCHGSDPGGTAGPHGSVFPSLLKAPYEASAAPRVMDPGELCFSCHNRDVYANRDAPEMARRASRFNAPGTTFGHAEHVSGATPDQSVPCYACHETHGSSDQKHLIAVGRSPGIFSYTETPSGGSCTSSCHDPQSYTVNYAR